MSCITYKKWKGESYSITRVSWLLIC